MKSSKVLLVIIMSVLLVFGWFLLITSNTSNVAAYEACLQNAQESIEKRLYEQAIEYYKESLNYKKTEETYVAIKETYDILYAEEHTSFFRGCYIDDMALAAHAYPDNEMFWMMQAQLYMEQGSYKQAFQVLKEAINHQVEGEELVELYTQLLYMVEVDYKLYWDYKTALNGYIAVFDGSVWTVLDSTGEQLRSNYQFIGLINDDGEGIYINSIDTRLLDDTEVTRARFSVVVEEAGYYNKKVDLVPVKIDGSWKYMNSQGKFLPGEYEIAGSFYGEQAAAKVNGSWVLVSTTGEQTKLTGFEDIKLDLYGCHIQNDIIIAKKNGKYRLYTADFEQIGDFAADDMDICINPEKIAFKQGDKWGFVDSEGNVVKEPTYAGAKSYANGYAAVCNQDGLWGFVNKNFDLVIDYAYLDAHYFTADETCLICREEGIVQILSFMFE